MTAILIVLAISAAYTAACVRRDNRRLDAENRALQETIESMTDRMNHLSARLEKITVRSLERHARRSEASAKGWRTRKANRPNATGERTLPAGEKL